MPSTVPVVVFDTSEMARARPKSATLGRPVPSSSNTFSGLMSRCTIPLACAAASAESTTSRTANERRSVRSPSRMSWRRLVPGTYSMVR